MNYYLGLFAIIWFSRISVFAQPTFIIKGKVVDENLHPLPGAVILLRSANKATISTSKGLFEIPALSSGVYDLSVSFLGYQEFQQQVALRTDTVLQIRMTRNMMTLSEVVVSGHHDEQRKKESVLSMDIVDDKFIKQNQGGSLMKSLDRLAGVSTIDIGSGQSKPVIRGLGFNRVVVVENGVKHEGQQWGADHGLEIDQYAAEQVAVVKGPASLRYGSDAIGGVIEVKQDRVPEQNTLSGSVDLTGKTNNDLIGTSISLEGRKEKYFATFRATLLDYGDYKVPTDSVDIYSYRAALHQNHLRNTAGNEKNLHLSLGYVNAHLQNRLYISNIYSKSGFFANAHGLEPRNVDAELHDKSDRDILFPYQQVSHLKIIDKVQWEWDKYELKGEAGFQRNFRQEWSQYVSHGYMPATYPMEERFDAELERQFNKYVYSINLEGSYFKTDRTSFSFGFNSSYQDNHINGRGFIIPAFRQLNLGGFVLVKYGFSDRSTLQGGVRYDHGSIKIDKYNDWFTSPVVDGTDTSYQYLSRAEDIRRQFSNISWSLGYNYNVDKWSFKANVGRSFRMPIAKELGANGVNYHRFSYEVGDSNLSPELSYQLDLGVEYTTQRFAIGISPFINYFTNYIYLNPTAEHDRLYGNGNQVFYYSQSKVLRYGGEIHAHYQLLKSLRFGLVGEYVYAVQKSGDKRGYTLPFSPPTSIIFNLKYEQQQWHFLENIYASVDYKIVSAQTRIVPPEEITAGYQSINLGLGGEVSLEKRNLGLSLQVQNVLDAKYFNHTSFYRLINVPESGRNLILNISIPFSGTFKKNNQ